MDLLDDLALLDLEAPVVWRPALALASRLSPAWRAVLRPFDLAIHSSLSIDAQGRIATVGPGDLCAESDEGCVRVHVAARHWFASVEGRAHVGRVTPNGRLVTCASHYRHGDHGGRVEMRPDGTFAAERDPFARAAWRQDDRVFVLRTWCESCEVAAWHGVDARHIFDARYIADTALDAVRMQAERAGCVHTPLSAPELPR